MAVRVVSFLGKRFPSGDHILNLVDRMILPLTGEWLGIALVTFWAWLKSPVNTLKKQMLLITVCLLAIAS